MTAQPRPIDRDAQPRTDDELDAFVASLPPCPGLPSVDDDDTASRARARDDIAAGRVHSHALVGEWLQTAGDPMFKPFSEWLAARNG